VAAALGRLFRNEIDPFEGTLSLLILTLLWVLPLSLASAILTWWVYDIVLPYVWFARMEFRQGLSSAWGLTRERFGTVLLFLVMRILVGICGFITACLIACASCVLWIWPALGILLAAMVAVAFFPAWVFVAPLILLLVFVMAWIAATVTAPIPLLYRGWSCAFVNRLDPSLPLWEPGSREGGTTP